MATYLASTLDNLNFEIIKTIPTLPTHTEHNYIRQLHLI